jgi:hypothetical protein
MWSVECGVWGSLRSRKPAIKWLVEVISLLDNRLRGNESVAVFPGGNWTRTTPQPTVAPSLSSSPHGNYCEALELDPGILEMRRTERWRRNSIC